MIVTGITTPSMPLAEDAQVSLALPGRVKTTIHVHVSSSKSSSKLTYTVVISSMLKFFRDRES